MRVIIYAQTFYFGRSVDIKLQIVSLRDGEYCVGFVKSSSGFVKYSGLEAGVVA